MRKKSNLLYSHYYVVENKGFCFEINLTLLGYFQCIMIIWLRNVTLTLAKKIKIPNCGFKMHTWVGVFDSISE